MGQHVAIIGNSAHSLLTFRGSLIVLLIARGWRVSALAPDHDVASRAAIAALGATPYDFSLDRTGMRLARDAADLLALTRLLRRLRPDCTLTYFIKPNIYGTMAARIVGVPRRFAMIEGLGYVFTEGAAQVGVKRRTLQALVRRLYAAALGLVDRAVFLNDDDIAFFVEHGLVAPRKVLKLGGIGVDLDAFAPVPLPDAPTFLLVARLLREKGVGEYLAAAQRVRARFPEARFLLVGGSDPNPGGFPITEVEQAVRAGWVEWPGAVADVRPWIARSTVFVLPSYREGVPRSTQEAMAMGRAVITTDTAGCRDTVEPEVNGILVPVRSVDALVEAMTRFILDPATVARMGAESRRIAERDFDARRKDATIAAMLTDGDAVAG